MHSPAFDGVENAPQFHQGKSSKKPSTNIKHEINIMNIINDNTIDQHNSLLNNDYRYMG